MPQGQRRLDNWLKSYLEYTSTSESPEVFHFWTGVSTIAAVLKRRVWIDQRYFEWTPNFYIIFVAPAGVASKSTTISIGTSLLREIDGVCFGPDSGTWQAIGKSLMEAQEYVPLIAGQLDGELEQMSCITCAVGELGTFLDFSDRKLIDTLTSLWDGQRGTFEHRTATAGNILIGNPWINIISGTTPAWLRKNVPEEAIGGGFASRVIFVFGDKKRQLVPYPALVGESREFDRMRQDLIHDLRDMSQMLGEQLLTPEAVKWGTEWYEQHWQHKDIDMASQRYDGYRARKQTHVHKLAIVIAAAESSRGIIDREHLIQAERLVTSMEADMIKVFESIGVAPTSRNMLEILNFLNTYKQQGLAASQQTLVRYALQIMSQADFSDAIDSCNKAGYIMTKQDGNTIYYALIVDMEEIGREAKQEAKVQ